ncbi:MAG: PD-(D/E)XK nuclease domain-containing protein [Saprospiraceae bacterium]|nr:PD-(D/E)XK nuclease domain-containing protein [Saprospiraceae bacterium]
MKNREKFFHAIVHLIFTIVGSNVWSEVHTPIGRIDTMIVTPKRIFLFEFKLNETAEAAIQCIKDRHYADALRHRGLPITGVGVSFSTETKGVKEWKEEEL